MNNSKRPSLRVGVISLGCAKNLVDAEIMLGSLLKGGLEIVNDAAQADAVIVNTCSFLDSAQEESIDAILESDQVRAAQNRGQALIVSGCLSQRFRDELPGLLPEVDAFMGIDQVAQADDVVRRAIERRRRVLQDGAPLRPTGSRKNILREIERHDSHRVATHAQESKTALKAAAPAVLEVNSRPNYIPDFATPRFRLTPKHFAYVKIAEGCNHPCSFCIIPRMRGSHRSRQQPDVVSEVRQLVRAGVKEINLISQDSTYYGLDLRPGHSRAISSPEKFSAATKTLPAGATTLGTLLRKLNAVEGDFWIRLLYTHPAHWTDELIGTIADCPKVARYVDMPLQHIHQNMLERMRRETSQEYIVELIRRIRAGIPGIALRTTFIVGFPGETEEYFQTLLDFVRATKFERLGVFAYSREEGTRAGKMENQIAPRIRRRRRDLLMAAQRQIAQSISKSFVGKEIKALIEGRADALPSAAAAVFSWEHGLVRETTARPGHHPAPAEKSSGKNVFVARGEADAPDIDGRIYVRGRVPIGQFATVRIVGHSDYDLIAEPVV
jgi:ribosomal protein S12 methylthiotransferase